MNSIISSPFVISIILPLATVFLITFIKLSIKIMGLDNKKGKINHTDFNIGIDVAYTAMLIFVAELFNNIDKLSGKVAIANMVFFVVIFVLGNIILSILIGLFGTNKDTGEIGRGSVFSLIVFGFVAMFYAYLYVKTLMELDVSATALGGIL